MLYCSTLEILRKSEAFAGVTAAPWAQPGPEPCRAAQTRFVLDSAFSDIADSAAHHPHLSPMIAKLHRRSALSDGACDAPLDLPVRIVELEPSRLAA